MTKRRREAWAKWRRLVAEQKRSGNSVAAFCRERGLCAPHFFAWKKRLRGAGDVRVEVVLKNGRSLRVGRGFDAELVRALVAVVESAA